MRRQAKAPSAFTPGRSAALALVLVATALLALAPAAFALKNVDRYVGSATGAIGNAAGLLNTPRGVAINVNGTGGAVAGDYYVVDSTNNRIVQYRESGTFVRAFGLDVVSTGPDQANEIQWVTANATAGTFKVTFNTKTTADLPFNASAAEVEAALSNLESIGVGGVTVSGGPGDGTGSLPYAITFSGGSLKGVNVAQMTAASGATPLSGGSGFGANEAKVTTARSGATGYEICNALANPTDVCKAGSSGGGLGGTLSSPQGIAIHQATGDLFVTDSSNRRIQKYSATGNWLLAFGWDTILNGAATGDAGNVTTFQVCTTMQNCRAGVAGTNAGQLSSSIAGYPGVDSVGNVYVPDVGNRRVQKFANSGSFLTAWGWDVIAPGKPGDLGLEQIEYCPPGSASVSGDCRGGTQGSGVGQFGGGGSPTRIAVDSTDKVYVIDPGNKRVQSFDSSGANPEIFFAYPEGTPGFAGDPADIAIGPSDSVFLIVPCPNNTGNLSAFMAVCPDSSPVPNERWLWHYDSDGDLLEVSLKGSGLTGATNGLAANPTNDRIYISGSASPPIEHRVLTLDDNGAPGAASEIGSASDVTASSAKLSGCVDPLGTSQLTASYRFQYSADGLNWSDAGAPVSVGATPIDCNLPASQLQASLTGLEPNTLYRARIATTRQFGNPIVPSAETTFLTDGAGPEATTKPPHSLADSFAWIVGDVDPNGSSSTYRFQWGTSTSYTEQVPLPEGNAGSGNKAKTFLHKLEGLSPDTTYHYRIVAESELGTDFGEDLTFTTRLAFEGFEGRGYQQVSPTDKNGYDVASVGSAGGYAEVMSLPVSTDGDAAVFSSWGAIPGANFGAEALDPLYFQSRRDEGGDWSTIHPFPRAFDGGAMQPSGISFGGPSDSLLTFINSDIDSLFSHGLAGTALIDPASMSAQSVVTEPGGVSGFRVAVRAASHDMKRQFFSSPEVLTSDPGVPPAPYLKAYEWRDGGEVRLVSIDTGGIPFSGVDRLGAVRHKTGTPIDNSVTHLRSVSDDGEQVFFTHIDAFELFGDLVDEPITARIYRRSEGTTTTLVSPSKRTPADPQGSQAKEFLGTDPSGDRVLFTSSELLTDDANTGPSRTGKDLYRYEVSTDTLVDISAEANTANGARVQGILGASDSLDHVYYVALGEVLPGKGISGQPNIYMWEDDGTANGATRFIGTLGANEGDNYDPGGGNGQRRSRVSANGQTAVFQTARSLTGFPTNGLTQVYAYEAAANGGQGQLSCASCRPNGTAPATPTQVPWGTRYISNAFEISRPLSADGKRVFFNSEEALVPGDTNGASDVYVWEEGRPHLISTGLAPEGDYFAGASGSGDDVFFVTRRKLVGQDVDDLNDLYDASTQGTLASQNQPPPPPPCQGEACKPAPAPVPVAQSPQSSSAPGTGNVKSGPAGKPKCAKGKVRRKGRCVNRPKRKQSKKVARKRNANESRGAGK